MVGFRDRKKANSTVDSTKVPPVGSAPRSDYYDSQSLRIGSFDFAEAPTRTTRSEVSRLSLDALVGASATDTVAYTSRHMGLSVFSELTESLRVIEQKFHAGMYDAQVMPLVEAFLNEVEALAQIQVEREAVNDDRVNDIKAANAAAYQAVYDARRKREQGIETARMMALDAMLPDCEVMERKMEEKAAKQLRNMEAKTEKQIRKAAEKQRQRQRQTERRDERKAGLKSWWSERSSRKSEEAGTRREEKAAAKKERKQRAIEQRNERRAHAHETRLQKRQMKLEERAQKQLLAAEKAKGKLEEMKRASELREAELLAKQAAASAAAEKAHAEAQQARTEAERARLEEHRVTAALQEVQAVEPSLCEAEQCELQRTDEEPASGEGLVSDAVFADDDSHESAEALFANDAGDDVQR